MGSNTAHTPASRKSSSFINKKNHHTKATSPSPFLHTPKSEFEVVKQTTTFYQLRKCGFQTPFLDKPHFRSAMVMDRPPKKRKRKGRGQTVAYMSERKRHVVIRVANQETSNTKGEMECTTEGDNKIPLHGMRLYAIFQWGS